MPSTNNRQPKIVNPHDAERRRNIFVRYATIGVVLMISAAITVGIIVSNDHRSGSAANESSRPSVVTNTGAYRINGHATPKVTLTLIEDFQCPACKVLESRFGDAIRQLRSNPHVAIDYQPIAILNRQSSTEYSTRAANASACVAESTAAGGDYRTWLAFHDALFAQQPAEGGPGLTNAALTSTATTVGAPSTVGSCITNMTYERWVDAVTTKTATAGLQGVPQIQLNGRILQLSTPDALLASVNDAVAH